MAIGFAGERPLRDGPETERSTTAEAEALADLLAHVLLVYPDPRVPAGALVTDRLRRQARPLREFLDAQVEDAAAARARRRLAAALGELDEAVEREAEQRTSHPEPSTGPDAELDRIRAEIDVVDAELLALFRARLDLARAAGGVKARSRREVRDPERERALHAARQAAARELGIPRDLVDGLFDTILLLSRRFQRRLRAEVPRRSGDDG